METSSTRDARISAFAITIDQLARLHGLLIAEFPDTEDVSTTIDIDRDNIDYTFSSLDDLRENYVFGKAVTDFRFEIRSENRSVEIGKPWISLAGAQVEVTAQSATPVWATGVVALAVRHLSRHRVWYHWMFRTGTLVTAFLVTSIAAGFAFTRFVPVPYGFDFLALPVALFAGFALFGLKPKRLSVCSLSAEPVRPRLPKVVLLQIVGAVLTLLAALIGLMSHLAPLGLWP